MAEIFTFPVSVKESGGKNYMINVRSDWNVTQVKEAIVRQSRLQLTQFKLVFAGMELKEQMTLQGIGVQNTSTLHCVRGNFSASVQLERSMKPLKDVNLGAMEPAAAAAAEGQRTQFYVYCKKPCEAIAPGKLRVRCAECKDTAFVLSKEPSGWSDVLTPRKMSGNCNSTSCQCKTAEFFFKCSSHHTLNEDTSVPLYMIRSNDVKVECIICLAVREMVVVFDCIVGHSICVGCFVEYMERTLNDRGFVEDRQHGYTIKCPAGCDGSEVKEIHHFRMMGNKNYDKYQRFGTEECVLQMGGILCPQVDCGNGLLPEQGQRRIECNECKHVFCARCKKAYHSGSCNSASSRQQGAQAYNTNRFSAVDAERARWVVANERYIEDNAKRCPRCGVAIQKTEGCNHMTCTCKFEFCWLCLIEWNGNCQGRHWFRATR
ncbi:E3 ubiquitin-protein ligase parkin-like isoform X2 [Dysidea avara]|uniref:E3 ubiquitin-protein ligase parkin-like isoform X2 n=1 Tax=Dysidea avara TaxID=196820 RepID=UPI00331C4D27